MIYEKQGRKILPQIIVENRAYLPLIEFLQILDLPYSESVSAGYLSISAGKAIIKLIKDRPTVQVNEASVQLPASVIFATNRWLVPPEFVNKVLNRVLQEKIAIGSSGNRFSLGNIGFNRLDIKGTGGEQGSKIVIEMSGPVEVEIKKAESKVIFSFGNAPIDPSKEDYEYRDDLVSSITYEESATSNQLVVQLSDRNLQTKVTHISSQNVYLLEVTQLRDKTAEARGVPLQLGVIGTAHDKRGWRHITIDPGHGGTDRGIRIRENLFEKDATLSIAKKIRWVLQTRLGVDVVLTRNDDQILSLDERVVAANVAQSDLFISIHIGNWSHPRDSYSYAYVSKSVSEETSVNEEPKAASAKIAQIPFVPWEQAQLQSLNWSVRLAECIQTEMNQALNGGDRSLPFRHAPLRLLASLAMPAVLLEIGNANHPAFKEILNDLHFQNSVAVTILKAVEKFRTLHERP